MPTPPLRQIRAQYDDRTIRVYQAYSDSIAESAIAHGTIVSPPFKMERMTWIKPVLPLDDVPRRLGPEGRRPDTHPGDRHQPRRLRLDPGT
ncbi:DUF4291 family protein [Pseudomonas asplenii]|uniref:DUF4291 family protein n=1 Tax=Pseudomonas asplenii TaxID=53407 RepID=UPI002351D8E4|nr:DUF4291 family protein [Pseudomonas fuscovaginae]